MTRQLASAAALLLFSALPALAAAPIAGTVTDRTTGKPAAGDAVVLIGFGRGMQEVARTTTDAQGAYSIAPPDEGTHLVRVDHQKATYFQPAPPGAHTVDVDVYDVAESVAGIRTEADVLSVQTDPQGLQVVENYFVKNDSAPPRTQLSQHAYELYLPPGAKLDASAAMGPAGMPVASSPIPLGDLNHYAFVFPIRPGETRFQISYHLPYSGTLKLNARAALTTDNLVVMLPKSMTFTPGGSEFQTVPDNVSAQTFVRKGVAAGQTVAFALSGTGSLPREQQGAQGAGGGQGAPTSAQPGASGTVDQPGVNQAAGDNRPGGGLGAPIDTPDPLQKYKYWILSALALALAVAAAFLLRRGPAPASAAPASLLPAGPIPAPAPPSPPDLVASLKGALFALEAERLHNRVSEDEYRELRATLDGAVRQAQGMAARSAAHLHSAD